MKFGGFIYIITNKNRTVLYIGSTTDIKRRIFEHKKRLLNGFSKKYNCCDLLFYEFFPDIADAAKRESQMKAWKRDWKLELIRKGNPALKDLSADWFDANGNLVKTE
jgi:putative endonuclease